jgi:periplasmic divalent cation tolerance protein
MSDNELLITFVSVPDKMTAESIARTLVSENVAACVSILPEMTSVYRWEGKIETTPEALLKIKSSADGYSKLQSKVLELHPYDTVEIVSIKADRVNPAYLSWVLQETHNG